MIKKIIISNFNNIAAIVKNNKIQELVFVQNTYQVNDIYIGVVQKIFTSINAAFVQLNHYEKSGFIHVNDIKHYSTLRKLHYISDNVKVHQKILVQIIKEPTRNKGPRLTTNIHLTGKYLILMPFNNTLHIAKKISDKNEHSFLHALGILIKPPQIGLLFKESSQSIAAQILIEELRVLKKQWEFIQKSLINRVSPALLYQDNNIINKVIEEYYDSNVKQIIVDSKDGAKKIYELMGHSKSKLNNTTLTVYKHEEYILDKFHIKTAIYNALSPKIELESGVCIFIEVSEALTVIDVNSGSFNPSHNAQKTILQANCMAATEIAYQLQLRNISGMIIIDFIDMISVKDKLNLLQHFHSLLKSDIAYPQIVQLSELGLVELTRRRRGKSLLEICEIQFPKSSTKGLTGQKSPKLVDLEKSFLDINTIFFKNHFTTNIVLHRHYIRPVDRIHRDATTFPLLLHSYIIPLELYSSLLDSSFSC